MDIVDRDMERAEEEATLTRSQTSKERYLCESAERDRQQEPQGDDTSSPSPSSEEPEQDMSRIATAAAGGPIASPYRTRMHPIEDHRIETHRLQHVQTVGATSVLSRKTAEKALPEFGGGRPYPPPLPDQEEYVVQFDGKDDPLHPQNWPMKRKLGIGAILAYTALCSTFTSSLLSASTVQLGEYFHISTEVATLSTSLFVLGYAFGPLIWGPFSELQGRRLPILVGLVGFSIFCFGAATSKDTQTVMICRFFTGIFGSCPLAVVAAIFSDIFDNTQRGVAIVVFASCVFMGPMLGPFVGGFIQASYLGWRWNIYLPGLMGCGGFVLNFFFLKESYPPVVLIEKAAELRRRTKNWAIHAKQEEVELDLNDLIVKNFTRPIRLLVGEPIILAVTLYMSLIYALLYAFLEAYPIVFQGVHHIKPGVAGLPFFGMIAGIIGIASYIIWNNKNYIRMLEGNDGIPVPEWRLPPVVVGGVLFSAGLFWFGWTGYTDSIPWIVPTLSGLFTGSGLLAIFICLLNYLIDSYLMFAASAVAANTFLRSCLAAGFPLFTRQMFNNLGVQYAGTLIGCLSAVCVPIPICFIIYGKKLRQRSKLASTMAPPKKADPENALSDSLANSSDDNQHSLSALHARAVLPTMSSRLGQEQASMRPA